MMLLVRRLTYALVLAALAALLLAGPASAAHPPRNGRILESIGIGGAKLGQRARVARNSQGKVFVKGPKLGSWGTVLFNFCLEGDSCAWRVPGGGNIGIVVDPFNDILLQISTRAPHYRTRDGLGRGSSVAAIKRVHPSAVRRTVCLGPAGGPVTGFVFHDGVRTTIFGLTRDGNRIDQTHVVFDSQIGPCG